MTKQFLNIGAGNTKIDLSIFADYEEIRADICAQADIKTSIVGLDGIADQSMDAVYASHVLEHVYFPDILLAIHSLMRVLKPEGFCIIRVPDIGQIADKINTGLFDTVYTTASGIAVTPLDMLYGHRLTFDTKDNQQREAALHKTCFTFNSFVSLMQQLDIRGMIKQQNYELIVMMIKDMDYETAQSLLESV